MTKICFLDFETTGIIPEIHSPLQLGAVLRDVDKGEILQTHLEYILPPDTAIVDEEAMKVNGLDVNNMPIGSVSPLQCMNNFFRVIGFQDIKLAAWNTHFDVSIFRGMCVKYGYIQYYKKMDYRHVCVQSMCHGLVLKGILPEKIKSFNSVIEYFGLPKRENIHNAITDAFLLSQVYMKLKKLGVS